MRALITGGTGLIGRALIASLTAGGHDVIALSRKPEKARDLPAGARAVQWDGQTSEGWLSFIEGTSAIVNLAGEPIAGGRWTAGRKSRIRESRLNAGRAIVHALQRTDARPDVLIQSSAVGYYGASLGTREFTEEDPPGDDFLAETCAAWEASTRAIEKMGVRRAVIRTGIVLSAEGGALPRMMLPFHFYVGGRIGSGRQYFSWIHIADHIAAIRFLMENADAAGPYNLTAPEPVTNATFARILGEVAGRPAWIPVPAFALRLLFGEMAEATLLKGQRVLPARLKDAGFTFTYNGLHTALNDLM